jgi:hypothetical protein
LRYNNTYEPAITPNGPAGPLNDGGSERNDGMFDDLPARRFSLH